MLKPSDAMRPLVMTGSGNPPDYVEWRRCPTDPGHWKASEDICPVCGSKIEANLYIWAGVIGDDE